ncbi:5-oxoprolinase subunit B family protein [Sagittula salina]|uniref:Carboxyltransferase domain-containing protein n=1 Tax=Sagittula salina TaxID=2820268 RepID=A0A940ML01_9RHOB|nr:carboxyltransferase domain-containing protein [Sagittula salina]MBP0481695.1 carboxyltransferase domain-containing protein [Sagittula salina]
MSAAAPLTAEVLPAGLDGFIIRFALTPDPAAMVAARRFANRLEDEAPKGVTEIAPALVTVLVRFDCARTGRADRSALRARMEAMAQEVIAGPLDMPDPARRWTIPVAFGAANGPQLAQVAGAVGTSEEAAVRDICAADLRVLTIGFAPGQPYVGLLPEAWNLPRMAELNPSVPAGALVVAVRQFVLFGAESATGWQQVGRAAFRTFVPAREEPTLLQGGDAIRFAHATPAEIDTLEKGGDPMGGARLEVLR